MKENLAYGMIPQTDTGNLLFDDYDNISPPYQERWIHLMTLSKALKHRNI